MSELFLNAKYLEALQQQQRPVSSAQPYLPTSTQVVLQHHSESEGTTEDHRAQACCWSRFPTACHTARHPDGSWVPPEKETAVELHCAHQYLHSNWVVAPAPVAGWPQRPCDITRAKKQPNTSGKKQPTVFKYLSINFRKLALLIKVSKVILDLSFVLCLCSTENNEVQLPDCDVEMLGQHK